MAFQSCYGRNSANFNWTRSVQVKLKKFEFSKKGCIFAAVFALLAQLVEQMTLNHWARSSSLREGTET